MTNVLGLYNYWVVIILMMTGFYIIMARHNLIKKVIGLNILQASVRCASKVPPSARPSPVVGSANHYFAAVSMTILKPLVGMTLLSESPSKWPAVWNVEATPIALRCMALVSSTQRTTTSPKS